MKELELEIQMVPGTCDTNSIEEIKSYAAEVVALYKEDAVVTSENVAEMKKDLASLRKLTKTANDEKIAKHNEYEKPYDEWLAQFKEAMAPLYDLIEQMAKKVKAYEDTEESKRIAEVESAILLDAENISKGLGDFCKNNPVLWALVSKPSYYNKSTSRIKSSEEWRTTLLSITRDLEVIKTNEDSDQLYLAYMDCGNLALAMQEVADNKKKLAVLAQQKAAAEERARLEAEKPTVDIVDIEPQVIEVKVPNENTVDPSDLKMGKALRWICGPKWKIKVLFKVGATLGLTFASYEEK